MRKKERSVLVCDELYNTQRDYYQSEYLANDQAPWDKAFDIKWLRSALKTIGPPKGKWALEIGAGRGRGAFELARANWSAIGLDYVFEPIQNAAMSANGAKNLPQFMHADAFEAPFRDHVFHLILDWGVFHHIRRRDTPQFIASITRLLAPGGVYILGCFSPRFYHFGEKSRKRNWTRHHGHYDRFSTKAELKQTFEASFDIQKIDEDPVGFYLLILTRKMEK